MSGYRIVVAEPGCLPQSDPIDVADLEEAAEVVLAEIVRGSDGEDEVWVRQDTAGTTIVTVDHLTVADVVVMLQPDGGTVNVGGGYLAEVVPLDLVDDLTGDLHVDLAAAIALDHLDRERAGDAENAACDICAAFAAGYDQAAAVLLTGATDTPHLDRVAERYGAGGVTHLGVDDPVWVAWVEHHRTYGWRCHGCDGFTYGDVDGWQPDYCGNCHGTDLAPPAGRA